MVATEAGERADAMKVLGKRKPAWSRTAPIVYGAVPLKCANANLPDVFHGSQWASLHRPLVEHMVRHPLAQKVLTALEHTLLPDEAMLQTIAVNSRFRNTIIGNHLRFIEWPQSHGDANKYWASVGPQFHGGPMVLNATLARTKAFKTSAMFARKVDPTVYENDVLPVWDRWMAAKMVTGGSGEGQPGIADNLLKDDPTLSAQPAPSTTTKRRRRAGARRHARRSRTANCRSGSITTTATTITTATTATTTARASTITARRARWPHPLRAARRAPASSSSSSSSSS